ncbi:peptidylprolyl isomerase [Sphingomonas sp. LY29]|uniref:peptidylprolyl isomerase n=1 Tax=Sphingomonas sp. LY29 TaxID=3095341 RepID=UPI002D793E3F|nr:peptidylprolyl isomerase [Sphingomonas sp. LY29]WRP25125.1 peptidylprolyl isomerase [Sphingomonas sp. LY29]
MSIRIALAALVAMTALPAFAQPTAAPAPAATPQEDLVKVGFDTAAGRIVLALDRGRAPITTRNFLDYIDKKKLDGESFYRAMPYGKGGLIQGGITTDARKLGKPIAHEATSQTGIKHVRGTVSMAALKPGSAQAEFFIVTTDIPGFDADASGQGFAAFGHVVEGMDVVEKILASPVSPTKGSAGMVGQMLDPAIRITKATRVAP